MHCILILSSGGSTGSGRWDSHRRSEKHHHTAPPHHPLVTVSSKGLFMRRFATWCCNVLLLRYTCFWHTSGQKLSFGCRCAARFCATSSDATSQSRVQHDKFTTASRHHNALCLVLNRHTPHLYAQIQHQAFTFLHFPRLPRPRGPADPRSHKTSKNNRKTAIGHGPLKNYSLSLSEFRRENLQAFSEIALRGGHPKVTHV